MGVTTINESSTTESPPQKRQQRGQLDGGLRYIILAKYVPYLLPFLKRKSC